MNVVPSDIRIPYVCPGCGVQVGELVEVDGFARLFDGAWLIQDAKRHCSRCGRPIHFKPPRDPWVEVAKRYLERNAARGTA